MAVYTGLWSFIWNLLARTWLGVFKQGFASNDVVVNVDKDDTDKFTLLQDVDAEISSS